MPADRTNSDETPEQHRERVRAFLRRLIRDGERTSGTVKAPKGVRRAVTSTSATSQS